LIYLSVAAAAPIKLDGVHRVLEEVAMFPEPRRFRLRYSVISQIVNFI